MKSWPLRTKLTAWSALLTGTVLLMAAIGTAWHVRYEQIEGLDDQLKSEAHTFFEQARRLGDSPHWENDREFVHLLPAHAPRLVELYDSEGHLLAHHGSGFAPGTFAHQPEGASSIEAGNESVRLFVISRRGLLLCLAAPLSEINADTSKLQMVLAVGLPLAVAFTALGGWWLARKALTPMREITGAVEQITAQRLRERLPALAGTDEVARLTRVLNSTFDRLDASFQQAARFTADASHELKTPLTLMRIGADHLLDSPTLTPPDREEVAGLQEQIRRLTSIIESLLLLSRADAGHLQLDLARHDLHPVITACTEDAAIFAAERSITFQTDIPEPFPALSDPARLSQLLLNLLINAVKYNHSGGTVRVEAASRDGVPTVLIANTGPGIPSKAQPMIFERFYRAEDTGGQAGQGLGLSLARELARAHGGDIVLESSDAQWTVFRLTLGRG